MNSDYIYAKAVYDIVKNSSDGLDAVYEDYIANLVGYKGLYALLENNLLETCGVVNGRQLYVLVGKGETTKHGK